MQFKPDHVAPLGADVRSEQRSGDGAICIPTGCETSPGSTGAEIN